MAKHPTSDADDADDAANRKELMRRIYGYWLHLRSEHEGRPVDRFEDGPVVCCGETWPDIRAHTDHGRACPTVTAAAEAVLDGP